MKLTVVTSFPIFPPAGGGQQRVLGLYSAVARRGVRVEVVALADRDARGGRFELAPGLTEIRVPRTKEHTGREFRLMQEAGVPVGDIALTLHHELTPAFAAAIAESAAGAAAVVASHPYAQPAIAAAGAGPLVYEAHNVETDLKAPMYRDSRLVDAVRDVEDACCGSAQHVMVCSPDDASRLADLFGLDPSLAVVVPNGVDPDSIPFTAPDIRARRKRQLGLEKRGQALFLGSWHEPNVVAARDVIALARERPGIRFLLVGSVGQALSEDEIPDNVDVCGLVDRRFLVSALGIVDVALNPMRFGSGTNLKMLDYALAGVPVISSSVGVRGLEMRPGEHYVAAEPDELGPALDAVLAETDTAEMVNAAREHVEQRFAWDAIAAEWLASEPVAELAGVAA